MEVKNNTRDKFERAVRFYWPVARVRLSCAIAGDMDRENSVKTIRSISIRIDSRFSKGFSYFVGTALAVLGSRPRCVKRDCSKRIAQQGRRN